jgi:hypothetical protein
MVCLNQIRTKVGVMYGDPTTTPGGMAIPFHSSVRIKLGAGSPILNKDKEPIGINVSAKTIKNKVTAPFRTTNFQIHFGIGIKEHEEVFDILRKHGAEQVDEHIVEISGNGAWKHLNVATLDGEIVFEKKFYKADFYKIMRNPETKPYVDGLLEKAMVKARVTDEDIHIDAESYEEMSAIAEHIDVSGLE